MYSKFVFKRMQSLDTIEIFDKEATRFEITFTQYHIIQNDEFAHLIAKRNNSYPIYVEMKPVPAMNNGEITWAQRLSRLMSMVFHILYM